ncbi:MAG: fumarylacetoacetate hydrolase family protein [Alphaproteobacteria bacterium]|nr:fumarylacetoacetate hydrolase family protein [Alphaproteobacteria bacterium]
MKLASYKTQGRASYGIIRGDGVFDLGSRLAGRAADMTAFIAAGLKDEAARMAHGAPDDFTLSTIEYAPPVSSPVLCIGVNYKSRPEEVPGGGYSWSYPSLFFRTPSAQAPHLTPMLRPPESTQYDYEGEIAIVIGKGGRRIAKERALEHIFGYSCFNEGSVRDWMKHTTANVTSGKNFYRSGSFGPWIATADEIVDPHDMKIEVRVNGQTRQKDTTANMMRPYEELIAYVSTIMPLQPGDVIATGTPVGVGANLKPPVWLVPGDVVELEVSGVGILRNHVEDEKP